MEGRQCARESGTAVGPCCGMLGHAGNLHFAASCHVYCTSMQPCAALSSAPVGHGLARREKDLLHTPEGTVGSRADQPCPGSLSGVCSTRKCAPVHTNGINTAGKRIAIFRQSVLHVGLPAVDVCQRQEGQVYIIVGVLLVIHSKAQRPHPAAQRLHLGCHRAVGQQHTLQAEAQMQLDGFRRQ